MADQYPAASTSSAAAASSSSTPTRQSKRRITASTRLSFADSLYSASPSSASKMSRSPDKSSRSVNKSKQPPPDLHLSSCCRELMARRSLRLQRLKEKHQQTQTMLFFVNTNSSFLDYDVWAQSPSAGLQNHLNKSTLAFDDSAILAKPSTSESTNVAEETTDAPAAAPTDLKMETDCANSIAQPLAVDIDPTILPSTSAATTPTPFDVKPLQTPRSPGRPASRLTESSVEYAAKQEATVLARVAELRKQGLWSRKRLPKCGEPARAKTHWDNLLQEAHWMWKDFVQERRTFRLCARKLSQGCQRVLREREEAIERVKTEQLRAAKRHCAQIAKAVKLFWKQADQIVEYKTTEIIEAKKRRAMDQHLDNVLQQTEKYSSKVQVGLQAAVVSSTPQLSRTNSVTSLNGSERDSEHSFGAGSDSSDDERTIAAAEKKGYDGNVAEEIRQLQLEGQDDDWMDSLPPEYVANLLKGAPPKDTNLEENLMPGSSRTSSRSRRTSASTTTSVAGSVGDEPSASTSGNTAMDMDNQSNTDLNNSAAVGGTLADVDYQKLTCDDADTRHAELDHIAEAALQFQPTGYTLDTAKPVIPVPHLLRGELREYQHVGLDWLVTLHDQNLNGILADEMGLGKTIQTIALLAHLACARGNWGPHLVVVPTSVLLNWEMEFKKWCPAFKIVTYFGSAKDRKEKRKGWSKPNSVHVCITSYTLVTQDIRVFKQKKWQYFILDEAQNIKNFKSQRWQLLLNMNAARRLLLTGTPLQNSLMELWALMHFLMPHVFASHRDFKDWFSNPLTGMVEGNKDYNEKIVHRLHKVLRPFILRRLKNQVEKQMPSKEEHLVMCSLSKRQRFLYDDFMSRSSTREQLSQGNMMCVLNVLMQLRKVCNHPNLFEPRPVQSPFIIQPISYQAPSLVLDLNRDTVEESFVPSCLRFVDCRFAEERRCDLCVTKEMIVELDQRPASPVWDTSAVDTFMLKQAKPFPPSRPSQSESQANTSTANVSVSDGRAAFSLSASTAASIMDAQGVANVWVVDNVQANGAPQVGSSESSSSKAAANAVPIQMKLDSAALKLLNLPKTESDTHTNTNDQVHNKTLVLTNGCPPVAVLSSQMVTSTNKSETAGTVSAAQNRPIQPSHNIAGTMRAGTSGYVIRAMPVINRKPTVGLNHQPVSNKPVTVTVSQTSGLSGTLSVTNSDGSVMRLQPKHTNSQMPLSVQVGGLPSVSGEPRGVKRSADTALLHTTTVQGSNPPNDSQTTKRARLAEMAVQLDVKDENEMDSTEVQQSPIMPKFTNYDPQKLYMSDLSKRQEADHLHCLTHLAEQNTKRCHSNSKILYSHDRELSVRRWFSDVIARHATADNDFLHHLQEQLADWTDEITQRLADILIYF